VIDISGDGANNQGRPVTEAREDALARGVTINGLPIMLNSPGSVWYMENLDGYFRDCIIGGPGAFMVPIRERHQFADAIRTKIIREIAGEQGSEPLVELAQATLSARCRTGERPWRRRGD
jgi:hypothetical protein